MSGISVPAPRGAPWLDRALALRDRVATLRDRLVANPRFRRWAAAFPLTRPIARRRTRALFDLCAGFVYSQVLAACVRLDVFNVLAEGPDTAAALSARLSLPPEATERLLSAAASLGLAARRGGGRYGLGPLGAAMVGNAAIAEMVRHHAMLYADLADPVALLRGQAGATQLGRFWPYAGADRPAGLATEQVAAYSALMAASQPLVADEVLSAHRFDRHRVLMDVGGGDGRFLEAAAGRAPNLRLILFDLPAVAERARARFAAAGLGGRATVAGGSFLTDPLPTGADLISLVRVIHDHKKFTVNDLHELAVGADGSRTVESVIDVHRSGLRSTSFRFSNIADSVKFKTLLTEDEEVWGDSNIRWVEDPCERTAGLHFD